MSEGIAAYDAKSGRYKPVKAPTEAPVERPLAAHAGKVDPEALAQRFHEAYERLAPQFGYQTRTESAKLWSQVPENNRRLMTAVCAEIARHLGFTVTNFRGPQGQKGARQ